MRVCSRTGTPRNELKKKGNAMNTPVPNPNRIKIPRVAIHEINRASYDIARNQYGPVRNALTKVVAEAIAADVDWRPALKSAVANFNEKGITL